MTNLTTIILTLNEELHIERCVESALLVSKRVCVVDSFSTDNTLEIAKRKGVDIFQNKFINNANQFQWALDNCNITTEWVMKMDADEYLTDNLVEEINTTLTTLPQNISGVYLKLQQYYLNKWIKFGGRYPLKLLRIWKFNKAIMEQKLMDEHIKILDGISIVFKNDFVHDNVNSLTWMINKHNNYATREAIEQLKEEYNLTNESGFLIKTQALTNSTHRTRFLKNILYRKELLLIRSIFYFIYRYFILLGFLDGQAGLIYHFLQGFWYRFLCDAKIVEIKYLAKTKNISIKNAIEQYSGYKI